jgi:hypothetical protein
MCPTPTVTLDGGSTFHAKVGKAIQLHAAVQDSDGSHLTSGQLIVGRPGTEESVDDPSSTALSVASAKLSADGKFVDLAFVPAKSNTYQIFFAGHYLNSSSKCDEPSGATYIGQIGVIDVN